MPQGAYVDFDDVVPGFRKNYIHTQFGLGFKVSRILADDDRYGLIAKIGRELGRSARYSVEVDAALDINRGFNSSYTGPDGKPLFATDHPLVKHGGVQANTLSVAADFSVSSLELALTAFRQMKDSSGKLVRIPAEMLVVPPQLEWRAAEVLVGTKRSDTANNTENAFRHRAGYGPFKRYEVWDYLTDPDTWKLEP